MTKLQRGRKSTQYTALNKDTCLEHVRQAYEDEGSIGQTVRHYFYKLLSSGAIRLLTDSGGNNAYKFVVRLLGEARANGILPYNAVIDPGRRSFTYWPTSSLDSYASTLVSVFHAHFDIWRGQPVCLELWCEKDGQAAFLHEIAEEYRVPVYINKGYGSITVMEEAARRYRDGREWIILYCGDFDPTGLDIDRWMAAELSKHHVFPTIKRIALTHADLSTLPVQSALEPKKTDMRYKTFQQKYGPDQKCYELEAMPASMLRQRIIESIESLMDLDAYRDVQQLEQFVYEHAKDLMSNVDVQQQLLKRINNNPRIRAQHRIYLNDPDDMNVNMNSDWDIDLSLVTDSDENIDLTLPE